MTIEPTFIEVIVNCHTENCENSDIAIETKMTEGGAVVCGPCGIEITDVQPK